MAGAKSPRPGEPPLVRVALVIHFVRVMLPPVLVVAAYTLLAALVVRWDMERCGEAARPLGEELYGMYTQLFFEPTEELPAAPIARVVFWITPLVGVFLIAEGLVKIGSSLLTREARQALWVRIMSEQLIDHVIVIGLGHVGFRVVESLQSLGEPIVAIEREPDSFIEQVRALGIPVLIGDARRDELLVQAGVERAKAVVCTTDDDLVNLEVALDAKRMNPGVRVVMRMFEQRLASKVGGALDLDETFSTSALAAPLVALQASHDGVRGVYQAEGGGFRCTVEIPVGPRFRRRPVSAIEDEHDARVIRRKGKSGAAAERVRPDTEITPGDTVLVDVEVELLAEVRAALR